MNVRQVYQRFSDDYGPFLNQVKVFAHRPAAVKQLLGIVLDFADKGCLSKRYLEIVLVVVSKLNECTYCVAHHTPRLIAQGLPPKTIAEILEPDCPGLDPVDRMVRDFAVQVTNDPGQIRDSTFDELKQHFSEEQLVELTLRTALCGFFNRFNDALQIGIEDGVIEEMLSQGATRKDLPEATITG